jgi:N-formylglutamate deformylase
MVDSLGSSFSVSGETDGRWPLVMASPHSGREYPPAFLAAARLGPQQLRRAEDPLVDELLDGVAGVPVLRARYARAFLDLNRAADELDPAMFEGAPPHAPRHTDRVAAGLGVLPRVAAQGMDIYRRRLAPAEAAARIAALHLPWHARITELLDRARARHGFAILLDCHSMPTPQGQMAPQIVLGDRHGTSASETLVALIEAHFRACGWRVGRNIPYAGGHTTEFHGRPAEGVHAVQIEIDRSLYLEPYRIQRNARFGAVAAALATLAARLCEDAAGLGLEPPFREAAE